VFASRRWEMGAESSAMAREQRGGGGLPWQADSGGFAFAFKQRCILQIYPYIQRLFSQTFFLFSERS
jgi:hypothetical protein